MASSGAQTDQYGDTNARITSEHIERARMLLGYDEAYALREPTTVASEDSIRTFAMSYGDDNPIHCDPDYARGTRWGSVIAPGPMPFTMGSPLKGDKRPAEIAKAKKSLFQGIHQLHSATEWNWYLPLRPGDRVYRFNGEESLEEKQSEFAGTSILRVRRTVFFNQRAEVVCVMRILTVLSERDTAAKRGKYKNTEEAKYSREELAEIDAIYAGETVRGADIRYWEDVNVGDTLGRMAKGPLTLSDIVVFHTNGFALIPWGPTTGRLNYQRRQQMPAAFTRDARGVPDTVMRMHWDNDWARSLGSPYAYDYGYQRECWLHHYLADWAGDDAIVVRMNDRMTKFNYIGDWQKIAGEVTGKRIDGGRALVDIAVRFTNQRGEVTVEADATIALVSRDHGRAEYPPVPDEIAEKARHFLSRHIALGGA